MFSIRPPHVIREIRDPLRVMEIREIRNPSRSLEIRGIRDPLKGIREIRDPLRSIRDFWIERFPLRLFLPAAALIALAAQAGARVDGRRWLAESAIAVLLLAQFRLWDDLADRGHDAVAHPERVLVRAPGIDGFVGLCAALAAGNLGLVAWRFGATASAALLCLNAVIAIYYASRGESRTLAGNLLILAKYPAFVLILATGSGTALQATLAFSALAIFAGAYAFDASSVLGSGFKTLSRVAANGRGPQRAWCARWGVAAPRLARRAVPRDRCVSARAPSGAVRGQDPPAGFETSSSTENVPCYLCGSTAHRHFLDAEDDLTGKPGTFHFVTCIRCGLAYQNPRVTLDRIGEYYDDQYIAHRKKQRWGLLTTLVERGMNKLDADKDRLVSRYVRLTSANRVLDVGCAVGTFLQRLRQRYGASVTGVDFKDLSSSPTLSGVEFHCSLFYDAPLPADRFDLVTMWHFLEHDYDPLRSLNTARRVLRPGGTLVIEVPRLDSRTFRWFGDRWPGLQAPQHTVLLDRERLLRFVEKAGFEIVDYLPYGAFPAYFYLATGAAFRMLKGRGLDLDKAIYPYFAGQLLLFPILLFERRLNLAMQTVVCRRPL